MSNKESEPQKKIISEGYVPPTPSKIIEVDKGYIPPAPPNASKPTPPKK